MINYQKRKNTELFRDLNDKLFLSKQQNYVPIYQRFFTLNESNYNGVNLNNQNFISGIIKPTDDQYCYKCKIKNIDDQTTKVALNILDQLLLPERQFHRACAGLFFH